MRIRPRSRHCNRLHRRSQATLPRRRGWRLLRERVSAAQQSRCLAGAFLFAKFSLHPLQREIRAPKIVPRRKPPRPSGRGFACPRRFCVPHRRAILHATASPTRAHTEVVDEFGPHRARPMFPSRIVSLAPSLTETVYALGVQDRLVGDTDYCDYPADAQKKNKSWRHHQSQSRGNRRPPSRSRARHQGI